MAYTETSTYGYCTGDELEALHIVTYASVDATYTEAKVMGQVSQAERWVNEYCGQSFTGTIPDGVKGATLEMARYFMNMQMKNDGHIEEFPFTLPIVMELCKSYLAKHKVSLTYSGSLNDYNLNLLRG